MLTAPAAAHDWFTGQKDPVTGYGCCGGSDCQPIPASWVRREGEGYRIILTLEQAKFVNPKALFPIDAFVSRKRIQPSLVLSFALCIYDDERGPPANGVICFFEPPAT